MDVQRYSIDAPRKYGMEIDQLGNWVRFSDYLALEAKLERLRPMAEAAQLPSATQARRLIDVISTGQFVVWEEVEPLSDYAEAREKAGE